MKLYAHPFSSYCWKVLIALYENATPFTLAMPDDDHPAEMAAWKALSPFRQMPLLDDDGIIVPESTIIIEHLQLRHPGPVRLLPADPVEAMETRLLDRLLDMRVMNQMQRIVANALRPAEARDPLTVAEAKANLDTAYDWLDRHMSDRDWAAGAFGLADCAAAPALFYADWAHPIGDTRPTLAAYRARLLARPSIARVVGEARPYRAFFPLGAPDQD